jgi:hypothetical protein
VAGEDLPKAYGQIVKKLWKSGDDAMNEELAAAGATRPGVPRVTVARKAGGLG